jgi:carboxyl-terminal processing protease
VYGGGGVMPDYFIPQDTSFLSHYYEDIFRKGLLNEFAMQYLDNQREILKQKYPDMKSFKKSFVNDAGLLEDFVVFAASKEVPRNDKEIEASGSQIIAVLKGLIARNLFNTSAYFEMIGSTDDDLIKAVEAINNETMFKKLANGK